jgi:hypothetical protein
MNPVISVSLEISENVLSFLKLFENVEMMCSDDLCCNPTAVRGEKLNSLDVDGMKRLFIASTCNRVARSWDRLCLCHTEWLGTEPPLA